MTEAILRGIIIMVLAAFTFALGYALGYTDADWEDAYATGLVSCDEGDDK